MGPKVLGISGSPVKNSNTDRLVHAVMDAAGPDSEFVKLSRINIRPCLGCKKCVSDNMCKVNDDFPELAEKIKIADVLIIGAYTPYGQIDAFTKALLERFWSLRHLNNLLQGKLAITVLTGLDPNTLANVNRSIASELRDYERMELIGQLSVQGNLPCVTCGEGDSCDMSAVKLMHGRNAKAPDIPYLRVEDNKNVWEEAENIGKTINKRLQENNQDNHSRNKTLDHYTGGKNKWLKPRLNWRS